MKINAPLNLAGNQLSSFKVQNANIAGGGDKLPVMVSSFAYDSAFRTMYVGTKDSNDNDIWSALLTPGNLAQYIDGIAVPANKQITGASVLATNVNSSLIFCNSTGTTLFKVDLPVATGVRVGLMSTDQHMQLSAAYGIATGISQNITKWNAAYGWGNHATVGYACAYKVEEVVDAVPSGRIYANIASAQNANPGFTLKAKGLVFNKTTTTLYALYEINATPFPLPCFIQVWAATDLFAASVDVIKNGNIIFCKGEGTIYKRENNAWVLVYESETKTDTELANRVSNIENVLGIDGEIAGNIDKYIEVLKFLEGVSANDTFTATIAAINERLDGVEEEAKKHVLYTSLKLNGSTRDDYNIFAPTSMGNARESVVVASDGTPSFRKTRMYAEAMYGVDEQIDENGEWKIQIFDSTDPANSLAFPYEVCVKIYENDGQTLREILADVEIVTETDRGQADAATRAYVKIQFYGLEEGTSVKAVIIC